MSASAPLAQPGYEQPPEGNDPATEAVIAALVVFFASAAAISAVLLPVRLIGMLTSIGVAPKAARAAGKLALSVPMSGRSRYGAPTVPRGWSPPGGSAPRSSPRPGPWSGPTGGGQGPAGGAGAGPGSPATPSMARRIAADEPRMRARYVLNAARRLTESLVDGEFLPGLRAERRYLTAHVEAGRNRAAAAAELARVGADAPGGWLRWITAGDDRVTPDCAALAGRLFPVDNPPAIPGAIHSRCRCRAVPAFSTEAIAA